MNSVLRKVDPLGRVVIPKEIRDTFNIKIGDPVEILIQGDEIIFQKYTPYKTCAVTGLIHDENSYFHGNLCLSSKGQHMLLEQLKRHLEDVSEK